MPSRPEGTPAPTDGAAVAFGLSLELGPGVEIPGLHEPGAAVGDGVGRSLPRIRVAIDPDEVERRWTEAGPSRRMRELRRGEETLLAVDLAEPAGYLMQAEGVARVLVSADGAELLCDPVPGEDWAFILSAQALPLAATLCGREVLHASAAVLGAAAALFAGEPGAGKSSLVAALVRGGAPFLGDDAIALERSAGALLVHPSPASLYLRQAEHDRLSTDERDRLGSPEHFASRRRFLAERAEAPVAFGSLFLLERAERGPAIEPISDVDPFSLLAATFNLSVRTPERLTRQLDFVSALAASGSVYRLRVLPELDATQLAALVEEHQGTVVG
jgi:hypothetical protein